MQFGWSANQLALGSKSSNAFLLQRQHGNQHLCIKSFFAFTGAAGTDVMILKIFWQKNLRKNWRFRLKTKLNYSKIGVCITLVFGKNANFFPRMLSKLAETRGHNIYPGCIKDLKCVLRSVYYVLFIP
jgi:hypothetical protein